MITKCIVVVSDAVILVDVMFLNLYALTPDKAIRRLLKVEESDMEMVQRK